LTFRPARVGDVARERLLLLRPNFLTRQWFDTACRHAHLRPNIALESTAPHALIALARVGYGVAVVPSHTSFDPRGLATAALIQGGKRSGRGPRSPGIPTDLNHRLSNGSSRS
jgi:DNA-binding transcriptional LysR family regulator